LLIYHVRKVNCFYHLRVVLILRNSNSIVIDRSVLGSFANTLSSFHHVGRVTRLLMTRNNTRIVIISLNWRKLLHIEFYVVHLDVSFGCLTTDKPWTNNSGIGNRLRKGTNIWDYQLVITSAKLILRRSMITENISIGIIIWINLQLLRHAVLSLF
jgi:hypothetical protein